MTTRGLRLTLIAGFGGMLAIFLIAAVDAVRLLNQMRIENQILRESSLERSRQLSTIRTYVLLCERPREPKLGVDAGMRTALSRALKNLDAYRSSTLGETTDLSQLRDLLQRHWRIMEQPEPTLEERTTVVEINTRVEDVDSRQLAATSDEMSRGFEKLAQRLGRVLIVALCAALLLAAGCIVYILRIEQQNSRRYHQIVEGRAALEQLSARLVDAQESERRAISRELHDEVGQTLGAVLVDAANLADRIPKEDTVSHHYLDNIRSLADASVNAIRNIALLLRPSMLDDLGLVPALEWQAREISRRSGVKVKVTAENVSDSLTDNLRTCVYRVVQEALHNVSQHSGAQSATVDVRQTDGELQVTVRDDGSGFNPAVTKGMGLLGMEERVRQLGGALEIDSKPGSGTTLRARLPLASPLLNDAAAHSVQNQLGHAV